MKLRKISNQHFILTEGDVSVEVDRKELQLNAVKIIIHPLPAKYFSMNALRTLGNPNKWEPIIMYVPTAQFNRVYDYEIKAVFNLSNTVFTSTLQRSKLIYLAHQAIGTLIQQTLREANG